ncbi:MAG TPA: acyltransferase [Ktedonobacteraceae bacterium]|nr:acyltransferase [Ktedonobacteraceae bacterium]
MSDYEDKRSNVQVMDVVERPLPQPASSQAEGVGESRWQRSKSYIASWLEPGPQKGTIPALDGVRALACLIVVGYHINLITLSSHVWFPAQQPFVLAALLLAGGAGVTLFFVLSGFLLFLPYARALLLKSSWPSARRFYMRRAFRIIPAYYICLFVLIALTHREYLRADHWSQLVLFLTFFMDSTNATWRMLNGPFWSLAVEWQFYLWLPWLALGVRALAWRCPPRGRLPAVIAGLLVIVSWGMVSQLWSSYLLSHPLPNTFGWNIVNVLFFGHGKYLQDFAIGSLISLLYIYTRYADSQKRLKNALQRCSPLLWVAGLGLLLLMALWNSNIASWRTGLMDDLYLACGEAGFSLGFGLCILALLFGNLHIQKLFSWTALRWTGHVSYSTYMWHLPLLIFLIPFARSHMVGWNPLLVFTSYWLWVLLAIMPFSIIVFILTERPGMQLSNWLARDKRKAA